MCGPRAVRAARLSGCCTCLCGGHVRRRVGQRAVCVGMARGCREAKNACHTRAFAAVEAASSPPRARGNPLCVCVRHTVRRTLRGVQLVRQGLGAGCGREGSPHALRGRSLPPPHPRVCACDRRAGRGRALEPKKCVVAAQPQVCGRGVTSGRKISNWDSRAKPDEAGGMRLDWGPEPLVRARLPSAARVRSKKREKGGRPKGTDSRGGAPDARRKPTLPTLFKTTRCPQSPRRRACCKVFRLRRRGGRWVDGENKLTKSRETFDCLPSTSKSEK